MNIKNHLKKEVFAVMLLCLMSACGSRSTDTTGLPALAAQFEAPASEYQAYVWWHWMGSNFSKEGITKDLEAMREAGIGGATIFNLASAVQETHQPAENNPWAEQTYRSEAYWEALRHAAAEAKRLGLKIGLHNTPGYSTTGGPWVTEERGMQTLVSSSAKVAGNRLVKTRLAKPTLPVYGGWGTTHRQAVFYRDVAVMAVPAQATAQVADVLNISAAMDADGNLQWQAPEGNWTVYRIGHAPTMSNPHPLPDELIGNTLEADKMSREQSVYHWTQMIEPLKEHLKEYIGNSFDHLLIDSYEAGDQNWTPLFREDFTRLKGYDPLPWIAVKLSVGKRDDLEKFNKDYQEVVHQLFFDNGWTVAKDMIHDAGLLFFWEPYYGPFDTFESVALPDVPMGEFWSGGDGRIDANITKAAALFGKRIVGAEAFTGSPERSKYTEDPAMLKHSTDGSFASGVNRLFLHHWVHQPFDEQYQPGMGMGWWGTHFGRNQTWIKPGKAYFTYLSRCQMLLQQGEYVTSGAGIVHRHTPDAEIFFVTNSAAEAVNRSLNFPVKDRTPELWDAYRGEIRKTHQWRANDDSTAVTLRLEADESVFVVFPKEKNNYRRLPSVETLAEKSINIEGAWDVRFEPKLAPAFDKRLPALTDFSASDDPDVKYFAGTATYRKIIRINAEELGKDKRILLDLGEMHDIAELQVNGKNAGVLWHPPYTTDVTTYLKEGDNTISVAVSVNWANRLIGDEQYPADFEWGQDRGDLGRAMKAFPDWFIKQQTRPQAGRKTFNIWYYYRQDSPLQPAGLIGQVRLVMQEVVI